MITENNLIMFNRQLFQEFGQGVFELISEAAGARLKLEGKTITFGKAAKGEVSVRHATSELAKYNEAVGAIDAYIAIAYPNGYPGYRDRVHLAITRRTEILREYRRTNA